MSGPFQLFGRLLFWAGALATAASLRAEPVSIRLNQCQVIGTHNSYHVAPGPVMDALIRRDRPAVADSLAYTQRSLREQLGVLGVRQLELDVFADPEGGRYAEPRGPKLAEAQGLGVVPSHDPTGELRKPGFKVLHVQDIDFLSRNLTFRSALTEIRDWSSANPHHFPIFVQVELKEGSPGEEFTPAQPFDEALLSALDREIREVIPAAQRFEPDQLRQGAATLREVVVGKGWPEVSTLLGRILFAMDNEGALRDRYLGTATNLAGRAMFVSVPADHPAAAWMKVNDAVEKFDEIGRLVREGFLVRTRADEGPGEARRNDVTRRDKALASGAQFVSTDYPEPNLSLSPYQVRLPRGVVARANPVTGAGLAQDVDLEMLAAETPAIRNARGEAAHRLRRLGEASAHYARVMELEPPTEVAESEARLARRFAPELLVHREEPFKLRDVAVVFHPERPWIAYHLFWEDDIDFPDDNDPSDHEIIWVECEPGWARAVAVHTYYHGAILTRPVESDGALQVAVEWGKHGSIPVGADGRVQDPPEGMRAHWERLHNSGRRLMAHPLGRGWPEKFTGSFEDFLRLDVKVALRDRVGSPRSVVRSRWPNAVLDQWILPYNFAVKTRWPREEQSGTGAAVFRGGVGVVPRPGLEPGTN